MITVFQALRAYSSNLVFIFLHLATFIAMFLVSPTASALWLGGALFFTRCFGITACFHRLLAHKSYQCNRGLRFGMAVVATMSFQGSPAEWVDAHLRHHGDSDGPGDPHSPWVKPEPGLSRWRNFWRRLKAFFWAHMGWLLVSRKTDLSMAKSVTKVPELRWLSRFHAIPGILLALACFLIDGLSGLVWGFLVSTIVLYHTTFSINSLCHIFGSKPFKSGDQSRNVAVFGVIGLGEGWHNNHHGFEWSAKFGLRWWQVDITWYILKVFSWIGLVWDLRQPTPEQIKAAKISQPTEELASVS